MKPRIAKSKEDIDFEYASDFSKGQNIQIEINLTNVINDAIFDLFYEMFGERYLKGKDYAIYFFLGNYDVKLKGTDKKELGESESVYRFMICILIHRIGT